MASIPKEVIERAKASVTPIMPVSTALALRGPAASLRQPASPSAVCTDDNIPNLIDEADRLNLSGDARIDFFKKHGCTITEIPIPQQEPPDNSPAMIEARGKVSDRIDQIAARIASGTNIQNLSQEDKDFIRAIPGDANSEIVRNFLPNLTDKQREDAKLLWNFPMGGDVEAYVSVNPQTKVTTAWRRGDRGAWVRAGWDAPPGSPVNSEEQAFDEAVSAPSGVGGLEVGRKPSGRKL